jgi:Flp pilus assembly protein TadB
LSKTFNLALSAILLFTALGIQPVHAQTATDARTEKARARVHQVGVGRDARVEIKLRDHTKLKGYVGAAAEDSFTLIDAKTSAPRTILYADVEQLKKPGGSGISTRTWAIIGAAAVAAVVIAVTVIKPVVCDGGAGC